MENKPVTSSETVTTNDSINGQSTGQDIDNNSAVNYNVSDNIIDVLAVESEDNVASEKDQHISDEINELINQANTSQQNNSANIPPSSLTFPKSGLDDIIEEEKDGDGIKRVTSPSSRLKDSSQSGKNSPDRTPSALPKSRTGNGSRSGRWHQDQEGLPNTSSTIYSTIGPSRGVSEFDQHEQWSISRGSHAFTSPLMSPAFSPSPGLISPDIRKSRVQIKNHGPVAKWLAKRQKKNEDHSPKESKLKSKKYASHIQPKVDTRNEEYSPRGGIVPPIKSEKLTWHAKPMVQTHNESYKMSSVDENRKPLHIMHDKLQWDAKAKVDMWNKDYNPEPPRKFQVFSEKLKWYEHSKLDTRNANYNPAATNSKIIPIVDETLDWSTEYKVDTNNRGYKQPRKRENVPVFHDKTKWTAVPKVDTVRPHYMPSVSTGFKVKTDKLNWSNKRKVDTFNPTYTQGKGKSKSSESGKNPRDNNGGWSSHSSDSETEWYNSLPSSGHKSPDGGVSWRPKKLFHSKDLVSDQELTSRSYPSYKRNNWLSKDSYSPEGNESTGKPFTTYVDNNFKKGKKNVKPKKAFKERVEPLPPIGTFSHRANEPVIYPEQRPYGGYRPPRSQKIEVIGMQDLSLLAKREMYSVVIN